MPRHLQLAIRNDEEYVSYLCLTYALMLTSAQAEQAPRRRRHFPGWRCTLHQPRAPPLKIQQGQEGGRLSGGVDAPFSASSRLSRILLGTVIVLCRMCLLMILPCRVL